MYIEVPILTNEQTLADDVIDDLQERWDGWEPHDGDLEVVIIEEVAHIGGDVAQTAAQVPPAVFRTIVEELHGLAYIQGEPATTTVTFAIGDTSAGALPAGTEINIDGWAFQTDDDQAVAGTTLAGVSVTAMEVGADGNGLTGENATMVSAVPWVTGVSVDTPTAGGADAETEEEYQDRANLWLQLSSETLVTTHDYELMALITRPAVKRVLATANTSTRTITVTASTETGDPLPASEKTALLDQYEDYRLSTWTVTTADATKTTITVDYTVHPYPNVDTPTLLSTINGMLAEFLDAGAWGQPQGYQGEQIATSTWALEPKVRKNKLIDIIGDVEGVNYVVDLTITGSGGSRDANGDWSMPGTVPLANGPATGHTGHIA